jgi:hypothetical protein
MTTADKDIQVLRRILSEAGKWLVHVHSGHIVKVARVAPEMSADAVLDDVTPRVSPKPASCHAEARYRCSDKDLCF